MTHAAMMAHGYCYLWRPSLVALHVGSDAVIGLSYLVISASLGYLLYRVREELPFTWVVTAFGLFIVAGGLTHLLAVWTVWWPDYWLSGWAKFVTAAVSVATAASLPPLIPRMVNLIRTDRFRQDLLGREEAGVRLALYGHQLGWDEPASEEDRRWTEALTRLLSCDEAELDESLDTLFERVHEDDLDAVRTIIAEARATTGGFETEFRIFAFDGSVRWLEARGRFWRRRAGVPMRLSGFLWDVTRRRENEERLRIVERTLQATANGVLVCDARDADLPIVIANESFTEITGYAREEALGRNCRFLNENARDQPALEEIRAAIREGTDCRVTLLNRRRSGEWFWNDLTISPVLDEADAEITHFVGVLRDVSAQMSLAAERERLLARTMEDKASAEQANRAKDEFLALLSHELRTPLQASTTWLQLAEKEVDVSPQVARVLAALRRSVAALSRLVEDLLESSRIIADRLSMDPRPISLVEVVDSTVHALEALAREKGVLLRVEKPDTDIVVHGDPQRLNQALRALIDNAVKFSAEGKEVVVELRDDGGQAEISVADDGIGVDPSDLPHLFDRFVQADTSRSRRHGGLGLGLFLVRSIMRLHDGDVRAESAGRGHGSRFTLWLASSGERVKPTVPDKTARRRRGLSGLRLLLVEDDSLAAEALAELLEGFGAEVVVAGTASAARHVLDGDEDFDLLLSDIGLPGEDGVSFIGSLREAENASNGARLPAVAMSGFTGPGEVAEMLAAGFDDHVSKPIEDFAAFEELLLSTLPDEADD